MKNHFKKLSYKTLRECYTKAAALNYPFIGMQDPQKNLLPGEASCFMLSTLPQLTKTSDTDCNVELNSYGQRLGSSRRMAVYAIHPSLLECPTGYVRLVGDVPNGDQFGGGFTNKATSLQDCADQCSAWSNCRSFEYNKESNQCFRNSQREPTVCDYYHHRGWLFCSKETSSVIPQPRTSNTGT